MRQWWGVMERVRFESHLRIAADQAIEFARQFVRQELPGKAVFLIYPNQSCDENPRVGDEVVYPEDSLLVGQNHGPWSAAEAMGFLWRAGKIPEWIDVAVRGEDSHYTLVGLRCCGRFTVQEDLLYHRRPGGIPPFSIKSPDLPPGWESVEESGKFDLYWRAAPPCSGGGRALP